MAKETREIRVSDMKWQPLDFKNAFRGLVVRHISGGKSYVIDGIYGDRMTATTSIDITNPDEWEILTD